MDTEFECSSCGGKFNQAAFAVVMYSPDAFAKILIFCTKECYRIPFHKALTDLTVEQRLALKNITVWVWGDSDKFGITIPNAEYLFMAFEEKKGAYEEQIVNEGDDLEMLKFEEEKNNPDSDGAARRLRRILLSSRSELSYPQNFKSLFYLLRGSLPEGPEKL
ncbi:MAG: hypothetical protein Q8R26_00580 [bacterium]|nr:hypothetical protein [bacterium]